MHGIDCIPDSLTKDFIRPGYWKEPFNDRYLNYSRDGLPIMNRISDIVERIGAVAEKAILAGGGKKIVRNGQVVYTVQCDF